jgi:hypothetical protein
MSSAATFALIELILCAVFNSRMPPAMADEATLDDGYPSVSE